MQLDFPGKQITPNLSNWLKSDHFQEIFKLYINMIKDTRLSAE